MSLFRMQDRSVTCRMLAGTVGMLAGTVGMLAWTVGMLSRITGILWVGKLGHCLRQLGC